MAKKKTKVVPAGTQIDAPSETQVAITKLAARVFSAHDRIDKLVNALDKCKRVKGI